jgi:hypothetical protein
MSLGYSGNKQKFDVKSNTERGFLNMNYIDTSCDDASNIIGGQNNDNEMSKRYDNNDNGSNDCRNSTNDDNHDHHKGDVNYRCNDHKDAISNNQNTDIHKIDNTDEHIIEIDNNNGIRTDIDGNNSNSDGYSIDNHSNNDDSIVRQLNGDDDDIAIDIENISDYKNHNNNGNNQNDFNNCNVNNGSNDNYKDINDDDKFIENNVINSDQENHSDKILNKKFRYLCNNSSSFISMMNTIKLEYDYTKSTEHTYSYVCKDDTTLINHADYNNTSICKDKDIKYVGKYAKERSELDYTYHSHYTHTRQYFHDDLIDRFFETTVKDEVCHFLLVMYLLAV